jgi:hypothetical protein
MISLSSSIERTLQRYENGGDCFWVFGLIILNYLLLFNQAMTALSINESQYEIK